MGSGNIESAQPAISLAKVWWYDEGGHEKKTLSDCQGGTVQKVRCEKSTDQVSAIPFLGIAASRELQDRR